MPRRLPWSDGARLSATFAWTLALKGEGRSTLLVWTTVPVVSRMIRPTLTMPSPVARTLTESEYSLFAGTVCVTRGTDELALRTHAVTGGAEPGSRLMSLAVADTVMRPRTGALAGILATAAKVTSRGPLK